MHRSVDGANSALSPAKSFEYIASTTLRANSRCAGVPFSASFSAAISAAVGVPAPCGVGGRMAHGDSCGSGVGVS